MTVIVLLFSVGILFIVAEVMVPGAILGTAGGVLMFAASIWAFVIFGFGGGMLALGLAAVIAAVAFYIEFRVLPRTRMGRRAFLTEQSDGVSAAFGKDALDLVGQPAEALTLLSPSGYVRIGDLRYEAFCQSGQAPVGSVLEVIGADSFRLIVTQRTTIP